MDKILLVGIRRGGFWSIALLDLFESLSLICFDLCFRYIQKFKFFSVLPTLFNFNVQFGILADYFCFSFQAQIESIKGWLRNIPQDWINIDDTTSSPQQVSPIATKIWHMTPNPENFFCGWIVQFSFCKLCSVNFEKLLL